MRPSHIQRARLCAVLFALQALLPQGLVLCVTQAGGASLEVGVHGLCLGALGGPSSCGSAEADPHTAIITCPSGCSDSAFSASLIRQSADRHLPAGPQAGTLASAIRPAVHGPALLCGYSVHASTQRGCGPPGGLGCIILRI